MMCVSVRATSGASVCVVVCAVVYWLLAKREKEMVRASFDLGSGEHKLVVARVRGGTQIVEILYSESMPVALGVDLRRPGSDGSLSPRALHESSSAMTRLARKARALGASEVSGVATAVFRRASNGRLHIAGATRRLAMRLDLVSQALEGELGFKTAFAAYRRTRPTATDRRVVSWDSGGGSFQLAVRGGKVYEGPLGSSDVLALLRDLDRFDATPNPVPLDRALALVKNIDLPPTPDWLARAIRDKDVVGFGHRTSIFRLAADVHGTPDISISDAWAALRFVAAKTDDDLAAALGDRARAHAPTIAPHDAFDHTPYPELPLIVPKLALLVAVMTRLGIARVHYEYANGNCLGVLVHPPLWYRHARRRKSKPWWTSRTLSNST
ncbi:hypothetical protein CTAYLR_004442 [Chrysophaeum taylorii]|uniref:Ppx/GppA phosphatase N-terminal domain-containing protein n=1 Tax=Chrysophaeum taylorii TaxID=2483200 RepID=A0AAD7UE77_9STRA|nr:hypothetical protein CTAYLR_004442 [Chrysophaeum taylorii]